MTTIDVKYHVTFIFLKVIFSKKSKESFLKKRFFSEANVKVNKYVNLFILFREFHIHWSLKEKSICQCFMSIYLIYFILFICPKDTKR